MDGPARPDHTRDAAFASLSAILMDKRVIGLDLGKSSIQVYIADSQGHSICQNKPTGSKVRPGKTYLRAMLVQGAHAVMRFMQRRDAWQSRWLR